MLCHLTLPSDTSPRALHVSELQSMLLLAEVSKNKVFKVATCNVQMMYKSATPPAMFTGSIQMPVTLWDACFG